MVYLPIYLGTEFFPKLLLRDATLGAVMVVTGEGEVEQRRTLDFESQAGRLTESRRDGGAADLY